MNLTNLSICGGEKRYCKESDLGAVPMPEQTRSYIPLSHNGLVAEVRKQLSDSGIGILQEVHSLARKGLRYFGLMQVVPVEATSDEMAFIIGLRNSYDKSIPASIACGNQVFVCDNLMFNGEVVLGRRHTVNIFRDLPDKIRLGIKRITDRWVGQVNRFEVYKQIGLGDSQAHDLIAMAYRAGAISPKQVADVVDQWHNPNHREFADRNVFALHNAFSEVWKQNAPEIILANSAALHPVLDTFAGVVENPVVE